MNEPETLGSFEERLLTELRQVVGAEPEPAKTPPVIPEHRSRLRRPLALVGGAVTSAAATLVAVLAIGSSGEGAAWAVTSNDDGTVTVEINSLADADGLERKLRGAGVPAVVEYERSAVACAAAPSAGIPVSPNANGAMTEEPALREAPPRARELGLDQAGLPATRTSAKGSPRPFHEGLMGMRMNGDNGVEFTLSKDVPKDTSLVITTHTRVAAGPAVAGDAVSVLYAERGLRGCKFDIPR
jgi:hypothetical protein